MAEAHIKISMYFINWNDSFYIPFIKKHYGSFCQKIVMFDNYSTDDSIAIAQRHGIEVRSFGRKNELNDQHYLDVKNNCWKEDRGKFDYVIVCDADEFLMMDNPPEVSCPEIIGYNMISESLPVNTVTEIKTGSADDQYSKQIIFDPNKIEEINYVHGCHKNHKLGEITTGSPMRMLHYRMIGGVERIINRHSEYRNRMSLFNKKHKMGFHYEHSNDAKINEWNYLKSKATDLW